MRLLCLLALFAVPACASNQSGRATYARDTAAAKINDTLDVGRTLDSARADSAKKDTTRSR